MLSGLAYGPLSGYLVALDESSEKGFLIRAASRWRCARR